MSRLEVSRAVFEATQREIDAAMWRVVNVLRSGGDLGYDFPTNSDSLAAAVRSLRADMVELDRYRLLHGPLPRTARVEVEA